MDGAKSVSSRASGIQQLPRAAVHSTASVSSVSLAGANSTSSASSCGLDSILPEFVEYQERYNRAILCGRHPRSFKMGSELWNSVNKSLLRVQKVSKGRNIWNVIDEDDETLASCIDSEDDLSLGSSVGGASATGIGSSSSAVSGSRRSQVASNKKPNLPPKAKKHTTKINGFVVNMESTAPIQYGSRVVIQNALGDILCIDAHDEARLKNRNDLDPADRVCFKLIDLESYDIAGPVPLGGRSKLWIQIVDRPGDHDEHLWQNGHVLGAKLFDSPAMDTVKIDPTYTSKAQQALDKAAGSGGCASSANICGSVLPVRIVEVVRRTGDDSADPLSGPKEVAMRYFSKKSFMLGQFTVFPGVKGDTSAFLSAMQPVYLGQDMYCISSSRGNAYSPWPRSATDIYFDTVDLSGMQPSTPSSRPTTAEAMGRLLGVDKREKKGASAKRKNVDRDEAAVGAAFGVSASNSSPDNSPSAQQQQSSPPLNSKQSQPRLALTPDGETPDGDYVCLRRIQPKGPSRASIFSFYAVNVPDSATKAMGDKDRAAQYVINLARKVLNRSEHLRKGGRSYEANNSIQNPGGDPTQSFSNTIYGGEDFVPGLRNVVSADVLLSESVMMAPYRKRNENLREVFRQELSQQFMDDRNDDSVHQSSKASSGRSSKKGQRGKKTKNMNANNSGVGNFGVGYSSDGDGSVSLDGSVLSYQLDDSTIYSGASAASLSSVRMGGGGTGNDGTDSSSLRDTTSLGDTSSYSGRRGAGGLRRRDAPRLRPMRYEKPDENALLLKAIHLNATPEVARGSPHKQLSHIHTGETMNDLLSIPSDNDGLSAGEMLKALHTTMDAINFNVSHSVSLELRSKGNKSNVRSALDSHMLFGTAPSRKKDDESQASILRKIQLMVDQDEQLLKASSYRQRVAEVEKLTRDFGDSFALLGSR